MGFYCCSLCCYCVCVLLCLWAYWIWFFCKSYKLRALACSKQEVPNGFWGGPRVGEVKVCENIFHLKFSFRFIFLYWCFLSRHNSSPCKKSCLIFTMIFVYYRAIVFLSTWMMWHSELEIPTICTCLLCCYWNWRWLWCWRWYWCWRNFAGVLCILLKIWSWSFYMS